MAKTKTTVINVAPRVHAQLLAFCRKQKPLAWPIGFAAEKAVEEFVERRETMSKIHLRKSAAGGEDQK